MRKVQVQASYQSSLPMLERGSIALESIPAQDFTVPIESPVESWRYRHIKRAFDLLSTLIMSIVFVIPGLLIAAAIPLTSPGSVFFCEMRIGRNGRRFKIWKFRSMHQHAHRQHHVAATHTDGNVLEWRMSKHLRDPRVTPVGRFLRRWSLDEIPQLLNVLRGEMSLIGPRPIVEAEMKLYGDRISSYLAVTPGLSGLWQVSGRSNISYEKRARLDALYVRSWSLKTDFNILIRTVPAVLARRGAN